VRITRAPLSELGIRTFREQVPVVEPLDPKAKTYIALIASTGIGKSVAGGGA
jgi:hypothetical protein